MLHPMLFLLMALNLPPILIRHDRPDSRYKELARQFATYVVDLNVPRRNPAARRGGNGVGVLIDAHWVLTAAHVAGRLQPGHKVTINGHDYAIAATTVHPQWQEQGPHDIALVKLADSVALPSYVSIYDGADEAGKQIFVIGTGDSGNGNTGPVSGGTPILRAATNTIDEVTPNEIVFDFTAPSDKGVTDLEGVSGPGDSGGPALIAGPSGRWFVAGVSVAQDGHGHGPGHYGATEFYTRVSTHAAWIREVMTH